MPSQQAITSAEVLLDSYSLVLFFKSSAFSNLRPYWKIVLRKKTMSPSFIGEKIKYSEKEVPKFGELPFDHFVLEEWDVASTKSEAAQRTDLVKAWLALGSQGRLRYHHSHAIVWSTDSVNLPDVPTGVPTSLQTPQQRSEISNECPQTIWVRTWYGNEEISREMSDEGYRKVCEHTAEHTGEFIRGNFAFEDHEGLLADRIAASTVTGVTPPYVQRIFEMYPDILETGGGLRKGDETYILGGQGVRKQRLMLVVIDKRACRTGAVLLLGIDDFGQMVPQRLRVKPGDVHQLCANWEDGQRLDENFCEGEDGEVDWFLGESAWISPFTRLCSDEHRAREL